MPSIPSRRRALNSSPPQSVRARLSQIRLLALDVDGVLTDGRLFYGDAGEVLKVFHVKDGSAIKRLQKAGVTVAIITAKAGKPLERRMQDLGVKYVFQNVTNKKAQLQEVAKTLGVAAEQVAYVGDDALDRPCFGADFLGIAPSDAIPALLQTADWVTAAQGGRGVVSEVAHWILNDSQPSLEFHVVIPARYASSRFPGKPLAPLAGKPMIQWVYEKALASGATSVTIATDDMRIKEVGEGFGAKVVMTSVDCPSGTDRLGEVATGEGWDDDAIIVNLQGDEPTMPGAWLKKVAQGLAQGPSEMATLALPIKEPAELKSPHVVKVVKDAHHHALYFSRSMIPYDRDGALNAEQAQGVLASYLRHLGVYAYRKRDLIRLLQAPPCMLEQLECLEQLRALHLGMKIQVIEVQGEIPPGVDTPEDLAKLQTSGLFA